MTRFFFKEKVVNSLISLVQSIRDSSTTLIEFKAQLMSQQEVMENLIIGKIEEAQFLDGQTAERERVWVELDKAKNENEIIKYEAEKVKWEAEDAKHRARITELRGALIEKITAELQFAEINMKQVFVLIEMVKEAQTDADILGAEARWEQLKAEAAKTMALAEQEKTKADLAKYNFEQESKEPID